MKHFDDNGREIHLYEFSGYEQQQVYFSYEKYTVEFLRQEMAAIEEKMNQWYLARAIHWTSLPDGHEYPDPPGISDPKRWRERLEELGLRPLELESIWIPGGC